MAQKIDKYIKDFFDSLEIDGEFEVSEEEDVINLSLQTEDSGMIIGYHGETLDSLQLVLALLLAKKTGSFKRVSLEVGDYKKNREEWLRKVALDAKERAVSRGEEVILEDLKPWERRVVHLLLSDDKEVVSESNGEGRERVLVIKPR